MKGFLGYLMILLLGAMELIKGSQPQQNYGSTESTQRANNQLLNQVSPRIIKKETVLTEEYLLMRLRQEAERYKKQQLNFNQEKNNEKKFEMNLEKKIEEKNDVLGKDNEQALYQKLLVALDTYVGDLRGRLEELKEALGTNLTGTTSSSSQLGTIAKTIKQVKTSQKKPKWNYSGWIGNGLHLGQFGAMGFLLYYVLTTLKK